MHKTPKLYKDVLGNKSIPSESVLPTLCRRKSIQIAIFFPPLHSLLQSNPFQLCRICNSYLVRAFHGQILIRVQPLIPSDEDLPYH